MMARSIFQQPSPGNATREMPAVTPMSGKADPTLIRNQQNSVRHAPNADGRDEK